MGRTEGCAVYKYTRHTRQCRVRHYSFYGKNALICAGNLRGKSEKKSEERGE